MRLSKLKAFILNYKSRYTLVVAFVLGGLLGALFIGDFLHQYEKKVLENGIEETKPLVIQGELLPESAPVILSIPKLNLEAPFTAPLGLETNGEVEVPDGYEEVGWYQYSPTPGELGPSIILGHVDSVDGPAIFWSLGELEPGDTVDIEREDGSVATFEITELARYEQAGFPTQLVYGDIDHAGLRLITCSGTFDKGEQRYSHNLVVYGRLITET